MLTRTRLVLPLVCLTSSWISLSTAEIPLETNFQMKAEVKDMRMAMERLHFTRKLLEDDDYQTLITNYMERLDFNHLYFLKSDEILWEQRFGRTLKNNYLEKNELYPAFYIFNTFETRVGERLTWTKEYFATDINLFEQDSYKTDDEDITWAQTEAESDVLWKQRLKNEILNEIVPHVRESLEKHFADQPIPQLTHELLDQVIGADKQAQLIVDAKEKILERYDRWYKRIGEMKPAEVEEDFLTELAQLYDPHSNFMSPDTSEDFGISISNELIGIGAVLSDDNGYCKILELIDGGPAKKSGNIKEGDTIVGVAQGRDEFEDVIGKRLRDIVRLIRGKEDSLVRLQIRSEDSVEDKIVTITRKRIKLEEKLASAELYQVPTEDGSIPVGVINLPNFYGPTNGNPMSTRASEDVDHLITKLKDQGVKGIVLDLRNNGGGLLDEAINITGLFISTGPVVKVKNRTGEVDINRDYDPKISWDGPLAVLTSRYSASASEIVAGALQYYKRALIIGDESTHGKGTVQTTFALPISVYDMYGRDSHFVRPNLLERVGRLIPAQTSPTGIPSMAKITIAKYYLPDGSSTQLKGVLSDIKLPSVAELLPIRESDLKNPLSWDNIEGQPIDSEELVSNSYPYLQCNLIEVLNERSQERQKSLEEFKYLTESISSFKERYDRTSVPLSIIDRINLINNDDKEKDLLKDYNKRLAEYAFQSVKIPLKDTVEVEPTSETTPEVDATAVQEVDVTAPEDSGATTVAEETTPGSTDTVVENTPESQAQDAEEEITEEEEDTPSIDIHLRESMRIVGDWIQLENFINSGTENRQIAIHSINQNMAIDGFHWNQLLPPQDPTTN